LEFSSLSLQLLLVLLYNTCEENIALHIDWTLEKSYFNYGYLQYRLCKVHTVPGIFILVFVEIQGFQWEIRSRFFIELLLIVICISGLVFLCILYFDFKSKLTKLKKKYKIYVVQCIIYRKSWIINFVHLLFIRCRNLVFMSSIILPKKFSFPTFTLNLYVI